MEPRDRVLVAVDTADAEHAAQIISAVRDHVGGVKLGMEFFNANGPESVERVAADVPLFLDLKYHDIPNTVAGAVRSAVSTVRPRILNVHASGGLAMMRAAVEANAATAQSLGLTRPLLIAVTVLTSLDDDDLRSVGQLPPSADQVVRLALLAEEAGCDGVVCSAREIEVIRANCRADFKLIVPGIRPASAASDDQKRTMTPRDALSAGADYLVIGRPITRAEDPAVAAQEIAADLA